MSNKSYGVVGLSKQDAKYQAEDDARILKRHAEVVGDKKRHIAAIAHIKEEMETLKSVEGPKG
jgi:hypothetical protein